MRALLVMAAGLACAGNASAQAVGANVNEPGLTPTRAQLQSLGARIVRTKIETRTLDHDQRRLREALREMGPEAKLFVVITHETLRTDAPVGSERYNDRVAEVAREIVRQNPGRIHAIEVWNEPDAEHEISTPALAPRAFADMLTKTYAAVKKEDPQVLVVSGGLLEATRTSYIKEVRTHFPPGDRPYDAVGVHPYGARVPGVANSLHDEELGAIIGRMSTAAGAPVMLTEIGMPYEDFMDGQDRAQALETQRAYFEAQADVAQSMGVFWSLHSFNQDLAEPNESGGRVHSKSFSIYNADGTLRPLGEALMRKLRAPSLPQARTPTGLALQAASASIRLAQAGPGSAAAVAPSPRRRGIAQVIRDAGH